MVSDRVVNLYRSARKPHFPLVIPQPPLETKWIAVVLPTALGLLLIARHLAMGIVKSRRARSRWRLRIARSAKTFQYPSKRNNPPRNQSLMLLRMRREKTNPGLKMRKRRILRWPKRQWKVHTRKQKTQIAPRALRQKERVLQKRSRLKVQRRMPKSIRMTPRGTLCFKPYFGVSTFTARATVDEILRSRSAANGLYGSYSRRSICSEIDVNRV
mmetsp:Transcript_41741/g.116300  ORF Transcript_41741/g.116300 Transcript_41741/m.116300 type:complete len:214 (-) Transcript_41741:26-667(-)